MLKNMSWQGRRMSNTILMVFCFVCFFFCSLSFADHYYEAHAVGWHWYDDPEETKEIKKEKNTTEESDPTQVVSRIRKTIKQALDQAIVDPTTQNVERYITLQNEMSERANQFSNVWQKILLEEPALNYSLSHPTNNAALQVYHEQESKEKEQALAEFGKRSGLFFFYRSSCPYCQRFAPILKNFAEKYKIVVIPITLDGVSLPEYPHSRQDSGQAEKFQVKVSPSLFLVDPLTQKAIPLAYGLTSETELRDMLYKIITHYQGDRT